MLTQTNNDTILKFIGAIIALAIIAVVGFMASTGNFLLVGIAIAVIFGILILFSPSLLLMATMIGSIVIAGLMQLYFPKLELIRWGIAGCSNFFFVYIFSYLTKQNSTLKDEPVPTILTWSILFIVLVLFSMLLNNLTKDAFLVGVKGYFQVWGIFFALALLPWDEYFIKKLPKIFFIFALIQLPFVLHQYLILVPLRESFRDTHGLVAIDIVSGTFGGNLYSGASNSALTVFLFVVFSGLVALWSNKVIGFFKLTVFSAVVLFPVFVNSTKVAAFYFIIVLLIVFRKEIIHKPFSFLVKLMVLFVLLGVLVISVIKHMPEERDINNWKQLLEYTYSYNFSDGNTYETNLSRGYALKLWWEPVEPHSIIELLIGYGPASSRATDTKTGSKVIQSIGQYGSAGNTAISAILWETGIIGIIFISGLFISGFLTAGRLISRYKDDPFQLSIFQAIQTAMVIFYVSLFHKNYFVFHMAFQAVIMTTFGYLVYWERRIHNEQSETSSSSNPAEPESANFNNSEKDKATGTAIN